MTIVHDLIFTEHDSSYNNTVIACRQCNPLHRPNNGSRQRRDLEKFHACSDCSIIDYKKFSKATTRFLCDISMHVCHHTQCYNYGEYRTLLSQKAPKHALRSCFSCEISHTYRKKSPYSELPTPPDLSNDTTIIALALVVPELNVGRKSSFTLYNTRSAPPEDGARQARGVKNE